MITLPKVKQSETVQEQTVALDELSVLTYLKEDHCDLKKEYYNWGKENNACKIEHYHWQKETTQGEEKAGLGEKKIVL